MKVICVDSLDPAQHLLPGQANNKTVRGLRLRTRFNPDLMFYTTNLDEKYTDAEIMAIFGNKKMRKAPNFTLVV